MNWGKNGGFTLGTAQVGMAATEHYTTVQICNDTLDPTISFSSSAAQITGTPVKGTLKKGECGSYNEHVQSTEASNLTVTLMSSAGKSTVTYGWLDGKESMTHHFAGSFGNAVLTQTSDVDSYLSIHLG